MFFGLFFGQNHFQHGSCKRLYACLKRMVQSFLIAILSGLWLACMILASFQIQLQNDSSPLISNYLGVFHTDFLIAAEASRDPVTHKIGGTHPLYVLYGHSLTSMSTSMKIMFSLKIPHLQRLTSCMFCQLEETCHLLTKKGAKTLLTKTISEAGQFFCRKHMKTWILCCGNISKA